MSGLGYMSPEAEFPTFDPDRHRRVCGNCGAERGYFDRAETCVECGWRLYATCPWCSGRWPRFVTPKTKMPDGPDKDALRFHRRVCPRRPRWRVVLNLVRLYWNHLRGHGCAPSIRRDEWRLLRGRR